MHLPQIDGGRTCLRRHVSIGLFSVHEYTETLQLTFLAYADTCQCLRSIFSTFRFNALKGRGIGIYLNTFLKLYISEHGI